VGAAPRRGGAREPAERVVRLTLAYDGSAFRGWAAQRDQRTVEGVLRDALARVLGSSPTLSVAGRTDAGVHARAQVASFAMRRPVELDKVQRAINTMLGPEVVATDVRFAPAGFDARFSARAREYTYRISTAAWPDPFEARFVWHRPGALDLTAMRAAARALVGEHDFTSFCRRPPNDGPTSRDLQRLAIARRGTRVDITARANAFLHQMVRGLVGTLVAVGDGSVAPSDVARILAARDRSAAAQLAPADGLTLERVVYGSSRSPRAAHGDGDR
jgi:tRNA pseudouridine38-40 synthase